MHLRVAMSLLAIVAVVECDQWVGTNQMETNQMGTNPVGTNPVVTNPVGTNPVGTNPMGTNPVGTNPVGTNPVGTNPMGTNPVGTNPVGTNSVGTNPVGTNPVGMNQMGTNTTGTSLRTNAMVTNPKRTFLQTVKNGLVVIHDLFYFIFGNVPMFRRLLTFTSELVASYFPLRPLPAIPEPCWGDRPSSDTSIRPFRVHWSNEMISDLRWRIQNRRKIAPSLRGAAHTYGTNSEVLKHLLDYWAQEYDFQKREDFLNTLPQYTTIIQGLRIHFIHVKPPNPRGKKVLPLLMLHGWPSLAFQYIRRIQLLLQEREDCDFVFEMVAPHNPGFGYSEATNKIGLSSYQVGIIMKNLMVRLGFPRFYIQANGLAQLVAETIAVLFPDRVLGLHTQFAMSFRPQTLVKWVLGQLYPPAVVEAQYQHKLYPLSQRARFLLENMGYFHVHATKPDNVGHGLDESPVALLSWIVEKLVAGSGTKNTLKVYPNMSDAEMGDMFDRFTVYWDTQSMTTAIRLYAEATAVIQDPLLQTIRMTPTPVPLGVAHRKEEIIYQPDDFIRDKFPNLVHSLSLDSGGHLSGYDDWSSVADSLRTAVGKIEQFHKSRGH